MEQKKFKFEFTKEELELLWEMVDTCLKVGGLKNLAAVNKICATLQKPIKEFFVKPEITENNIALQIKKVLK